MSYTSLVNIVFLSVILAGSGTLTAFAVNYIFKYREKKTKERKELQEAAKMFEQRIALKPRHMGARIGLGVSGDVHFGSTDNRKE